MIRAKRKTPAKKQKRPAYAKGGATVSNKDMAMALQILMKKLGMKPPK